MSRDTERRPWGPRDWVAIGFLLLIAAGIAGAAASDEGGASVFAIAAIPGSLMVTVGVIAKGVQVGIRSSRQQP